MCTSGRRIGAQRPSSNGGFKRSLRDDSTTRGVLSVLRAHENTRLPGQTTSTCVDLVPNEDVARSPAAARVSVRRAPGTRSRESQSPDSTSRCARARRFPFTRSLELAGRRTRVEFPPRTDTRAPPSPDPSSSRVRRGPLGDAGRHARSGERRASRAPRHARAPPKVDGLGCPTRSPRRQTGRRRALTVRPRFQPDAVSSSLFLPRPRIRWSPRKPSSAATPMDSVPADARWLTERSWSSSCSFVGQRQTLTRPELI